MIETGKLRTANPMVVAEVADIEDENRFEALFASQKQNDRSGKFSLARYSAYTRTQKQRKLSIQRSFKSVVKKLMNKQVSSLTAHNTLSRELTCVVCLCLRIGSRGG